MTGQRCNTTFFVRAFLLLCLMLGAASAATAQVENCFNGIDDDGDNLVDVFDPDCPCDEQTLICAPGCEFAIPGGPLNFQSQWQSADLVPTYQTPLVADMDADGVPDLIILSSNGLVGSDPRRSKDILIINGATGATMATITTPYMAWVGPTPIAVADVDSDGFGEIIFASMDHTDNPVADRRYLYCYEHNGVLKWKSNVQYGYPGTARFGSSVGIIDFNNDGIPEVYAYNQIFNALTGRMVISGGASNGISRMTSQGFGDVANPVAADVTSSPGLELVCGNTVYNIVLTNNGSLLGNSMTPITMPGIPDGYSSVADINLDGRLDIITATEGSTGHIYVWNPNNGSPALIASAQFPNTGGNWIGVPFIGDMDKDCQPEIGVTRSRRVYALEYDGSTMLAPKWTLVTSDASGFTGITMFDFNQDGRQELVYRDETTLRIIDGSGSTPVVIGINPCESGTGAEMPVVADVDGDGQAEICVTCAVAGSDGYYGRINVFESSGQAWAPCRPIWNQFNYFNVNINSNLTVPRQQQPHSVLLSTEACPFYTCNENRPFNSFLAQATFLTQKGCPIYPASDVSVSIVNAQCNGSAVLNLTIRVQNENPVPSDPNYPIRFYAGNPLSQAAIPIASIPATITTGAALDPGESQTINLTLDIRSLPKPFNLYLALNDNGSQATPFSFPVTTLPECDYSNNIAVRNNIDCCPSGDLAINGFNPATVAFCENDTVSLSVLANSAIGIGHAGYSWTFPDTTTHIGPTLSISDGGTYNVTVTDSAQCKVSSSISVTEFLAPTAAAAGPDQLICTDTTSLEGNIPSTGTGTWSLVSGSGTIVTPTSPTSKVNGIGVGINLFRWTIINGGICIFDDTVAVERLPPPSPANAGNDQQLCVDASVLSANTPAVGTGAWTLVSGQGTPDDPASPVSAVSNLGIGANVFRWTISNGICAPSSDLVTLFRHPEPSTANAGSDFEICSENATLAALPPDTGTGTWTVVSGSGTFADPDSPLSGVSGLSAGANVFRWTVSSGNCAVSTDEVSITRHENPSPANAGTNQQICTDVSALNAGIPSIGTGSWHLVSGTATISDTAAANSAVTGIGFGTAVFAWTVRNGNCPISTAQVSIQRDMPPSASDAGPGDTLCIGPGQLQAVVPSVGTGLWSLVSGTGTVDDPAANNTSATGLSVGNNVFRWTVSNGVCPSTESTVILRVDEPVTPPNAGAGQQLCTDNTTLQGNTPLVGTGSWSLVSGTATIGNPSDPQSTLTGIGFGTAVLRWTITNGTCSDSAQVNIVRYQLPTIAVAGDSQDVCGTTAELNANTALIGTGNWSVAVGNASFPNPADPSVVTNNLSIGINRLVWTISNGACPASTDTVTITVSVNPISPDAGPDVSVCDETAELNAVPAVIGSGSWSVVSGSGSFADSTQAVTNVSNLSPGANVFRWTVVNGACTATDQVTVTRYLPPSAALAGDDQTLCTNSTTLAAEAPLTGTGSWSRVSGSGALADTLLPGTTVGGLGIGNNVFRWTVRNGVCPPQTDEVTITVNALPSPALAGNDQTLCTDTTRLAATAPATGTGAWSLVSGTATIADTLNASSPVSGLVPGTTAVFRWTVRSGVCPPVSDEVSITVDEPPTTADAGDDQTICTDTTTLAANAPLTGQGSWSIVTGSGTFENVSSPTTRLSNIGTGVNVFQWNISNGSCPPSTDQLIIIRDSLPVQAQAGPDQTLCNSDTVRLQATDAFPGTGLWTIVNGSGTFNDPTDPATLVTDLGGANAIFRWTVTTGACPPTSDEVAITNNPLPSPAVAGNDTALCSTLYILSAQTPVSGTGNWTVFAGSGTLNNPASPTAEVSNLSAGINTLIWTVSSGVCPPVSDTLQIAVDKNPVTPNAGPDFTICADTLTLSAAAPAMGTGAWSVVSGGATINNPASPVSGLSGIAPGITVLRWTVTNGLCEVFDEMQVRRDENPSVAVAGDDQLICDSVTTLAATAPVSGTGAWTLVSGSGVIADPSDPASGLNNLAVGTNVFRWTVSNGVCPPSGDNVSIVRQPQPDVAVAGNDRSVCVDTVRLTATPAVFSTGTWTLVSGSGVIASPNQPNTTVNGLGTGPNVFRWTIPDNGSCPGSFDEVTITRDAPPSEAVVGDDEQICGDEIALTANSPATGTGRWLLVGGNAVIADTTSASTTAGNLSFGNNVFEWRITNGVCPPETDQVTIFRGDTAAAGPDQTLCDTAATLDAVAPIGGTGIWTVVSGTGSFADSSASNTGVSGLSDGPNVFAWTIRGSVCADSSDTVVITRKCNIPPVTENESFTIDEDEVLNDTLLTAADFDPDGTALTVDTVPLVAPANGQVRLRPDGTFTYTPNQHYHGNDTIVVNVCDNGIPLPPLCTPDTIFITINPVNDPPVIFPERYLLDTDSTLTGNILANGDYDPDSTQLTVDTIPLSGPSNGSFVIDSSGAFTYIPNPGFTGTDTILITVCDNGFPLPPLCGVDTVVIFVNDTINDPPIVRSDTLVINEDESGSGSFLSGGDHDPDGTALTVDTIPLAGPSNGSITIQPDGSYTYTPNPNYYGLDTVVVTVCDSGVPLPPKCVTDTLFIRINPVNDPPVLFAQSYTTQADIPVTGNILGNGDYDPDSTQLVVHSVVSGPTNGSFLIDTTGTFLYTPNPGFTGTDTILVTVCDNGFPLPPLCGVDTVVIFVNDTINDPPVVRSDTLVINEDESGSGSFLAGDYDPDGTALTVDTIPLSGPSNGSIVIQPDGSYTYTPNPNYNGPDTVVVNVCDAGLPLPPQCVPDTLFIIVNPVNDPPVLFAERYITQAETPVSGNILENGDYDPDSTHLTVNPLPVSGPVNGSFVIDTAGNFTYTPNPGFTGNDTILVTVCDNGIPLPPLCGIDTVIIQVNDTINDPPVVQNDYLTINEDESGSGSILPGDYDPDGTPLSADTVPLRGPSNGTIVIHSDGSYTYTPNPNYYGLDTVVIAVCDSGFPLPPQCVPDTLFITINPVNDPPVIVNDSAVTRMDEAVSGNIQQNNSDIETPLTLDTIPVSGPSNGTIVMQGDGSYTYTPNPGFTGRDTIVFNVCDTGFPLPPLCGYDTLFIVVNELEELVADAGPDQTICAYVVRLAAQPAVPPATGVWSVIEGGATVTDTINPESFVTWLSVGANRFVWTVTSGNQQASDTVLITVNEPATPAFAGEDQLICGISTELLGNTPVNGTGTWSLISGTGAISDPASEQVLVSNLQPGEHVFAWTIVNGPCSSSDTIRVTSFAVPQANAGTDTSICPAEQELRLNGTARNAGSVLWEVLSGEGTFSDEADTATIVSGMQSGRNVYLLTVTNGPCTASDSVAVTVLSGDSIPCKEDEIFIPEGFSPDADGVNDVFVIYGTNGKRVRLEVYNRWGDLVYESSNYMNDWDGTSNQKWIIAGERLPESTYYYIVQIEGEAEARKGYLTLWR